MDIPVFDAHCDTIYEAYKEKSGLRKNSLHVDLERGRNFRPYAQVFAVFTRPWAAGFNIKKADYSKDWTEDILTRLSGNLLAFLISEFESNADILSLCRSVGEAKSAAAEGKIAAFIAVEGAELLGCSIQRLHTAYEQGVRLINICWNYDNILCGAANGPSQGGLTSKGAEFVAEMQRLGVAVDLSHASERTFWDVAELSTRPIIAGHSNSKAICANPRNLTDDQFRAIVRLGGAAGLNLCPDFLTEGGIAGIEDIIRHAEHFLELGGEKALCLGGDLDGISDLPIAIRGIEDYSRIYEAMLRLNWQESLVQDIFYNNLMNVLEAAL